MTTSTAPAIFERRVVKRMASQFGVISRAQAFAAGMSRSVISTKVRKQVWVSVFPGVYKVAGSPDSWEQKLMAALLWAGKGAVVSHRSAARLWRLEGFFDRIVEITFGRSKQPPPGIIVHRRSMEASDQTRIGAFPVTKVARTIFDLASVVPLERLLVARDDALRRRLTAWRQLYQQLDGLKRGQDGARTFRKSLEGVNQGESYLERLFLRMCRKFGIPPPVLQYEIRFRDGTASFIDFAFPEKRLAVEVEGFGPHGQEVRWRHDLERANKLLEIGWRPLRYPEKVLVEMPEKVARRILACLATTGASAQANP